MSRRTRKTLLIVAAVLLVLALAVFLRSKAPPEAARLLPESDGIIYFNLKAIRTLAYKEFKAPNHVPEYQQFIDAIGIDPERDIDQVAIALHRMPDPNGPNGPVAYSMVLVGKITGPRLNAWLDAHATSRESYVGHTIYSIPSEGRTVRVAQIGYNVIAVTNTPTTEQIHSILDRHRAAALPFSGSSLLERHYHDVPLLSLVWGVGQIGLPFSESGSIHVFGFALPLEPDSTIIASIAPALPVPGSLAALRIRVEEIAPTQDKAVSQAADLTSLVTLARALAQPLADTNTNIAFKELLKTAQVAQHGERVVITATIAANTLAHL
ncbi:MAG TPA: hypothetical protein VHX11_02025 [Acidobacteriaceae bacterium]|jgi:hypothetical protein|nr:hypothetical protein [Acidobacteriaceae bacterium]